MQITDILRQVGGVQSMARELGVSQNQATSGAAALGRDPAGFKKQAQGQPTGQGLGGLLSQLGGGGLFYDGVSPNRPM